MSMSSSPASPWKYGEAKSTPGLPGSRKECSVPITLPPTVPQQLWWEQPCPLGCSQALPSICWHPFDFDDHHDKVVDDKQRRSLAVILESSPNLDIHVRSHPARNSLIPTTTVHTARSEIATSLINVNLSVHSHTPRLRTQCTSDVTTNHLRHTASRSLTGAFDVSHNNMLTTIPSAPGSPPDLSGSRSSASSSSYCSSISPNHGEGLGTDITHYEEITLDDSRPEKPVLSSTVSERRSSQPRTAERPTARAHIAAQLREAVKQHEQGLRKQKSSTFTSLRRGVTMPPMYETTLADSRPRSASPPKRLPRVQSGGPATLTPGWQPAQSSAPLPTRRSSWQPKRKTVRELEAECNDSDDELPEEATLWNVPVSPHVGPGSSRSSLVSTPNRSPVLSNARPIPLSHSRTAPDSPPRPRMNSSGKHKHFPPRSSSAHTARSNPVSPKFGNPRRPNRARSWNLAMGELSEEARIISQNLELHALREQGSSAGAPFQRIQRPATIQLPPIQKGSLDFMPISKEKEAVLSRTRPSWLPPKDPREEQKHLKEYQKMMAASLEVEKKKQTQTQTEWHPNESDRESLTRIWAYYCDEATNLDELDPRIFSLCWRGVPSKMRGTVWKRSIGNSLGLNAKSYQKALERAHQIEQASKTSQSQRERTTYRWLHDIERDAETAFPELNMFQQNGPLWQDLVNVCKAYACYRSDIGHVYGLQLIAALLLLQLPTAADVFIVLANALHRSLPLAFLSGDISTTARTYSHAVSTLAIKFPRAHEYLFGSLEQGGLGLSAEQVFEPMFRTLFTNGLDVDRLCRVWDIWAFEGDKILIHTAVALVGSLQAQLFDVSGDIDLRRRNIQEMLAWGPFNRTTPGEYWKMSHTSEDNFVEDISFAGKLDYRGK